MKSKNQFNDKKKHNFDQEKQFNLSKNYSIQEDVELVNELINDLMYNSLSNSTKQDIDNLDL